VRADAYCAVRLLDAGLTALASHWAEGAELRQRAAFFAAARWAGADAVALPHSRSAGRVLRPCHCPVVSGGQESVFLGAVPGSVAASPRFSSHPHRAAARLPSRWAGRAPH
jgi:hypothetical protein